MLLKAKKINKSNFKVKKNRKKYDIKQNNDINELL